MNSLNPSLTPNFIEHLMQSALEEAEVAASSGEVPVGAVIAYRGEIVARAHNTTERDCVVTAHAELLAIAAASQHLGNWRLSECVLCVTLEPCTMCMGAIRLARLPVLIFGAGDSRQGAVGSLYDLSQSPGGGEPVRVITGVERAACEGMLQRFFQARRNQSSSEEGNS